MALPAKIISFFDASQSAHVCPPLTHRARHTSSLSRAPPRWKALRKGCSTKRIWSMASHNGTSAALANADVGSSVEGYASVLIDDLRAVCTKCLQNLGYAEDEAEIVLEVLAGFSGIASQTAIWCFVTCATHCNCTDDKYGYRGIFTLFLDAARSCSTHSYGGTARGSSSSPVVRSSETLVNRRQRWSMRRPSRRL
jgi:hypothetical protein